MKKWLFLFVLMILFMVNGCFSLGSSVKDQNHSVTDGAIFEKEATGDAIGPSPGMSLDHLYGEWICKVMAGPEKISEIITYRIEPKRTAFYNGVRQRQSLVYSRNEQTFFLSTGGGKEMMFSWDFPRNNVSFVSVDYNAIGEGYTANYKCVR